MINVVQSAFEHMMQKNNKQTKRYIIMTGFKEATVQIIPDDDPLRVKKSTFYLLGNIIGKSSMANP